MSGIKIQQITSPKITVVTVTYNAQKYLEQTIKSVIEQDYSNIEYIIIDGASTDGTIDIIKKYEKYINYWISEPDSGIYDAMNKGIDVATGQWINFMNAGDSFSSKDSVWNIIEFLISGINLFYGGTNFINNKNKIIAYSPPNDLKNIFFKMPCVHQSLFVRTSIMKRYKFNTNFKINADLDFLLKCHKDNFKYTFIDKPIANFQEQGTHNNNKIKGFLEELYVTSKYMPNESMIYSHESYKRLKSYQQTNNEDSKFKLYDDISFILKKVHEIDSKYSNIVLYGNSSLTKFIKNMFTKNIKIVDRIESQEKNIIQPENLQYHTYDIVIITLLGREKEIKNYLVKDLKIDDTKITTLF
jgi:glycosyltransferase involved in cell wall biosynthesis